MSLEEFLIKSLIWLVLVTTGWYFGARAERGHLKSLMADEQNTSTSKSQVSVFMNPKVSMNQSWWLAVS